MTSAAAAVRTAAGPIEKIPQYGSEQQASEGSSNNVFDQLHRHVEGI
jgi:hypothetical protein